MPTNTHIRPPVVDNYDDKGQREVRTAITQISSTLSTGRLIGRQILTNSGVYTPNALKPTVVHAFILGGGGGGGGATGAGAVSVGGGGASGTLIDVLIVGTNGSPIVGGAYSCGAGGAAGSSGGGNGGTGANTTITINGTTYTALGGGGGLGGVNNIAGFAQIVGGAPATETVTGGLVSSVSGTDGLVLNGGFWSSGDGGGLAGYGTGGNGVGGSAAGQAGSGFGAGGGGAAAQSSSQPGGVGSVGAIVIYEFS